MTRNTRHRLLIFFFGIPLFIALVVFVPFERHVVLAILVTGMQALAIRETAGIFKKRGVDTSLVKLTVFSLSLSALVYIGPLFPRNRGSDITALEYLGFGTVLGFAALMGRYAFTKKEHFESIIQRLTAEIFIFIYCGVFGSFLVLILSGFANRMDAVFTFTLMTFGNDSLAWLVGMTLGKRRGIVDVSPGKSLAGFIGGFAGSLIAAGISYLLFPTSFPSPFALALLGLLIGATTISGDLVESALKRAVGVKDSSALVPGRGGILDSFDSLLFSAPLFVSFAIIAGFFGGLS